MALPKFYSLSEVGDALGVSRQTLLRLMESGDLVGVKMGRVWRFSEDDIRAFIDARSDTQPTSRKLRAVGGAA